MPDPLLLGAIADDYTGAADLASMLREEGMRTGLLLGLQSEETIGLLEGRYQAVVIALKTRSAPVATATEESLRALDQLRRLRARQVYFKYCSTFDSTPQGNIGPVTDALMAAVDTDFTVAVPALPVNGRTQYQGHLFVGERLLSDSHMRHHPVTPMTESDLVRHLQAQTDRRVGLIPHAVVRSGASAVGGAIERLRREGVEIALVDATSEDDLSAIAEAVVDLPLITGGSGLGITLPAAWARRGLVGERRAQDLSGTPPSGGVLVLAGSCSAATLEQVSALEASAGPGLRMDVLPLMGEEAGEALDRLFAALRERVRTEGWALVYSSAGPDERRATLAEAAAAGLSPEEVSARLERATGELARRAVREGIVKAIVVAGGETTGAVTQALGLAALEIGPALDPGVPVARSIGPGSVDVVFKSGNFGGADFFLRALRHFGSAGAAEPAAHRTGDAVTTR